MRESKIEAYLKTAVEGLGGDCQKHVSPGRNGVVDRVCIFPFGIVWFVETKRPDGELRALQERERDELLKRGANWALLDTKRAVDAWIALRAKELWYIRQNREQVRDALARVEVAAQSERITGTTLDYVWFEEAGKA